MVSVRCWSGWGCRGRLRFVRYSGRKRCCWRRTTWRTRGVRLGYRKDHLRLRGQRGRLVRLHRRLGELIPILVGQKLLGPKLAALREQPSILVRCKVLEFIDDQSKPGPLVLGHIGK